MVRVERRPDGLGIDVAHELADVLLLPVETAMRRNAAGKCHCIAKVFGQGHGIELAIGQGDQRFTQILQALALAFQLAFARTEFDIVVRVIVHARDARPFSA
jgi:hypothetical protein